MKKHEQIILPERRNYYECLQLAYDLDGEDSGVARIYFNVKDFLTGIKIQCTLFYPLKQSDSLIVYQHSYLGNKLEGIQILNKFLPKNAILWYDLPGLGNSEHNYTTLGYRESDILETVLKECLCYFPFDKIFLIGKCIGAVTIIRTLAKFYQQRENDWGIALKILKTIKTQQSFRINREFETQFAFQDKIKIPQLNFQLHQLFYKYPSIGYIILSNKIKSIALDSPFNECSGFIKKILKTEFEVSRGYSKMALAMIRKKLIKKINFDIEQHQPIKLAQFIKCPVLLIHQENSHLVDLKEIQKFIEKVGSDQKRLQLVQNGQHYDHLNFVTLDVIEKFFNRMQEENCQGEEKFFDQERKFFDDQIKKLERNESVSNKLLINNQLVIFKSMKFKTENLKCKEII